MLGLRVALESEQRSSEHPGPCGARRRTRGRRLRSVLEPRRSEPAHETSSHGIAKKVFRALTSCILEMALGLCVPQADCPRHVAPRTRYSHAGMLLTYRTWPSAPRQGPPLRLFLRQICLLAGRGNNRKGGWAGVKVSAAS